MLPYAAYILPSEHSMDYTHRHCRTMPTDTYVTATSTIQLRISLSRYIALLLVYKARGGIVATGLLR